MQNDLFSAPEKKSAYYNTNNEKGDVLKKSKAKVSRQERMILAMFQSVGGRHAPHHVLAQFGHKYPITSIRRALTNLADAGLLEKTDHMTMGNYGKMVHTWRLK